jgi:heat shock protein HslJ
MRTRTTRLTATLATLGAVAAFALAGCATPATSTVAGTWQEHPAPAAGELPELVLAADGGLSGTDGCNSLAGSWTSTGSTVSFGEVAATLMACDGVDEWLLDLATGTISGDTLTILDASGATIGELHRAS